MCYIHESETKTYSNGVKKVPQVVTESKPLEDKSIELRRHALNFANQIAKTLEIEVCKECGKNKKYN